MRGCKIPENEGHKSVEKLNLKKNVMSKEVNTAKKKNRAIKAPYFSIEGDVVELHDKDFPFLSKNYPNGFPAEAIPSFPQDEIIKLFDISLQINTDLRKRMFHYQTGKSTLKLQKNEIERLRDENWVLQHIFSIPKGFVFDDVLYPAALRKAIRLSCTDNNILIYGKTGTGKETFANIIHANSKRKKKKLQIVDCGMLSRDLAKSELFGHEKGAFTGATQQRKGLIEEADGGTIFFDELDKLDYDIQSSLLRFLQDHTLRRVGGNKSITVDCRCIFACNESLKNRVREGTFRPDLYFRINQSILELPTFAQIIQSELPGDLEIFFSHYFSKFGTQDTERFLTAFHEIEEKTNYFGLWKSYSWPGNIREFIYHYLEDRHITHEWERLPDNGDIFDPPGNKELPMTDYEEYCQRYRCRLVQMYQDNKFASKKEAADFAGISEQSFYKWEKECKTK